MIGLEFTYNDGTKDHYDPIDYDKDFEELDNEYVLHMTYTYNICKNNVTNIRKYQLCSICNYELKSDICDNCN